MNTETTAAIPEHFSELADPRQREPTYELLDVIGMAICWVKCRADDSAAIPRYARNKTNRLGQFPGLSSGVASHNPFNVLFGGLRPADFERATVNWLTSLLDVINRQIIAVDGEQLQASYDKGNSKTAIHMVSVWPQRIISSAGK